MDSFIWNSQPDSNSSYIKVACSNSKFDIKQAYINHHNRGFGIDVNENNTLISKPFVQNGRKMKIHISYKNNEVILFGFYEGYSLNYTSTRINWKSIKKGDSNIGTPWWEVMNSFSYVVDNLSEQYR
ncbi:hypothetical protein [Tenacibaculum ovolyticum]|uniref:hypothetical protein n=1 Tax=Tenacibaculum ovolyticum TaxID=104270 RepID=UPI0003F76ECA|nr:hypothetical protein [Tenacibaculum ovolyticum]